VPAIDLIYFDAGGGHRAAANALTAVCRDQQRPWDVRLINLQELLDPLDIFRKITSIRLEDLYNRMLAKGWTLGSAQILKVVHAVIRLHHNPAVGILQRHWTATRPDLVVSVVPNFNRILLDGLRAAADEDGWVAEEPEVHLLPHIVRHLADGAPFTLQATTTDPDGTFVVTVSWDGSQEAGRGAVRTAAYALIAVIAESTTEITQNDDDRGSLVFEVVTGMLADQTRFATHGHRSGW
jgi:hypothetical protein